MDRPEEIKPMYDEQIAHWLNDKLPEYERVYGGKPNLYLREVSMELRQMIIKEEHERLRALFEKKKRTIPFEEWTDDESKTNKYNDGIESCIAELQQEESPTTLMER